MTILQTVLAYEPPISERELQALVGVRDVYGIWALKFDEEMHRIIVGSEQQNGSAEEFQVLSAVQEFQPCSVVHRPPVRGSPG